VGPPPPPPPRTAPTALSCCSYVREVLPGEIIRLDADGVSSFLPFEQVGDPLGLLIFTLTSLGSCYSNYHHTPPFVLQGPQRPPAACVFEYVYFARPDSILEGQQVHNVRTRLGSVLAREQPCPGADIVSGVPDSSIAAAIGYATHAQVGWPSLLFGRFECLLHPQLKPRLLLLSPTDTLHGGILQKPLHWPHVHQAGCDMSGEAEYSQQRAHRHTCSHTYARAHSCRRRAAQECHPAQVQCSEPRAPGQAGGPRR
jgi:hypothetical protein